MRPREREALMEKLAKPDPTARPRNAAGVLQLREKMEPFK